MDIGNEMATADGLGAEVKAVKKAERNEEVVTDDRGNRIREGDEVHLWGYDNQNPAGFGTVTSISEEDGDATPEGQIFSIPPSVHVEFRDESSEDYPASWNWREERWEIDELEAL